MCHLHYRGSAADAENCNNNLFHVFPSCESTFSPTKDLPLHSSTLLIQIIHGAPCFLVLGTARSSTDNDSSSALPLTMCPKFWSFSLATFLMSCLSIPFPPPPGLTHWFGVPSNWLSNSTFRGCFCRWLSNQAEPIPLGANSYKYQESLLCSFTPADGHDFWTSHADVILEVDSWRSYTHNGCWILWECLRDSLSTKHIGTTRQTDYDLASCTHNSFLWHCNFLHIWLRRPTGTSEGLN